MLWCENVSKDIDGRPILKNINLEFQPGKATAIIGPNGTGKTVLLYLLAMIEQPTNGNVFLKNPKDGVLFSNKSNQKPWPLLTMVFQKLFLWPHLTIEENLLLAYQRCNLDEEKKVIYNQLVSEYDLNKFLRRYPNEISLGERQRVAIVRALLLEPSYLLLDEVTASLDIGKTQKLFEHLFAAKKKGLSIIFVTHMLGLATQLADEIIFLDQGAIKERGGVAILKSPKTPELGDFLSLMESNLFKN